MLAWMIVAGIGAGTGLVFLVSALAPARPDLRAAVAATTQTPASHHSTASREEPAGALDALADAVRAQSHRTAVLVRLGAQDLSLLNRTPAQQGLRKLAGAGLGALLPGTVAGLFALATGAVPITIATGLTLAGMAIGFVLPDVDARARAQRARAEVRHAVGAYLVLVALERRAGSAAQQSLVRAARVADGTCPTFARIRTSLDRAQLDRLPAWEGLRALAAWIDVTELRDCADIMDASADGAAVADTLLARARSLRGETLNGQRARANEASERMVVPVALLGLCFVALLMYPVLIRLLTL